MRLTPYLLAIALWAAGLACAPAEANDFGHVFQTRTDTMNAIDKAMKTVADMVKGRKEFDVEAAQQASRTIATHARAMPSLFPPGSNLRPSEARAEIWLRWEAFVALTGKLAADADQLANATSTASAADNLRQDLLNVGANCKACHELFRAALAP